MALRLTPSRPSLKTVLSKSLLKPALSQLILKPTLSESELLLRPAPSQSCLKPTLSQPIHRRLAPLLSEGILNLQLLDHSPPSLNWLPIVPSKLLSVPKT